MGIPSRFWERWKAILTGTAVLCSSGSIVAAGDWLGRGCDELACDEIAGGFCERFGEGLDRWYALPQHDEGWKTFGWLDSGFIGNTSDPDSGFNGPYNAVDQSNQLMMNQLYLVAERSLPKFDSGFGARIDLLYGEDFLLAQSQGFEVHPDATPRWNSDEFYGLAIPQAYLQAGSQDLNVQFGHFYTIIGYEGVPAPNNFFYSKAYSYQFAGPFTHWGGMLNYRATPAITMQLGLVNGWEAIDRISDDLSVLGKIRYDDQVTGGWTSFALITGKEFNNVAGLPGIQPDYANRTRYSWLIGVPVTCRTEYVFHQWYGAQSDGVADGGTARWYGIDQYLTYALNRHWRTNLRFEWFRDEDGTRVGLNRRSNPNNPPYEGNFYSLSTGVNWMPTGNLMVRPEIRADWYDGNATRLPFDDGSDSSQLMLGLDAMLLF